MANKGYYARAFRTLVLNLQYALKDEYLKSEEINGALSTLNELVARSSARHVVSVRDGIGDASIPYGSYDFYTIVCPNCDEEIENVENEPNYCARCGQHLKWSEDDE